MKYVCENGDPDCGRMLLEGNTVSMKLCRACVAGMGLMPDALFERETTPRRFPLEAAVTIDGRALTQAQVTTIRVAVTSFRRELQDPAERAALGPIGDAYEARLRELEAMLVRVR